MPKQNARKLLIKMADDGDPQTYTAIGGLTTRTINLNGNLVDITSIPTNDPGGTVWREVIAGIQSVDVSGNGYFESKTEAQKFITAKNEGTYVSLEIVVPGLGTFAAEFAVGNVNFGGELEGAVTQELELQSSGAVTFTAEGSGT